MKSTTTKTNTPQIVLLALILTIVALKLTRQIEWSWLWVLSPLWATYAIATVGAVFTRSFGKVR